MTTALAMPGPFSVITLAEADGRASAWRELLDWPDWGHTHVALSSATAQARNASAARLDDAVLQADKPVLLLAEGAACFAAAWWARLSPAPYVARVAGALLFRPLVEGGDTHAAFASPKVRLPFPSLLIDEMITLSGTQALAGDWGSQLTDVRDVQRGRGRASPWRQAQRMIERYTLSVVVRDVRTTRNRLR
jgi:predicted alpha/beta hydrolase family esterase